MGTVNQTITEVVKKIRTPGGRLTQIELSVALVAFLLLYLVAFGSSRHHIYNSKLKIVLSVASPLSGYLITYTLGLMRESPFHNPLFPLWATFSMIFLGSSNSFSAYSDNNREQLKKYAWEHMVRFIGLLALWTSSLNTLPLMLTLEVFVLYFVLLVLRTTQNALSLPLASERGQQHITKWVADHMSSEHCTPSNPSEADPKTMKGYNYVVKVDQTVLEKISGKVAAPKASSKTDSKKQGEDVITIEEVWACEGWLLSSTGADRKGRKKDICLSYALYLLLRLKLSHYPLKEEAHQKAGRLIQEEILKNGYERAFRVAEVELTFLRDFFYTNYHIIFQARLWQLKVAELLCSITGTMLTVILLMPMTTNPQDVVQMATSNRLSVDVLVTAVVLILFICVELVQLFLMAVSYWAKVRLLCNYVQRGQSGQRSKCIEKLTERIFWVRLIHWDSKLRQYSFLDSYNYVPSRPRYFLSTLNFIDVVWSGQKQNAPVRLSEEVKEAVFKTLKNSNGKLENGQASLRRNDVKDLFWACKFKTTTEVIMVWHIATSFLEHKRPLRDLNFNVATKLSKYLAYLVVFAPRLLPDHLYQTENLFDQVILEARQELKMCETYGERINRLKDIAETPEDKEMPENTVIHKGAQLGVQLLKENKRHVWKILADFWAELIVYVAPSDKAKEHVEHLEKEGEFVTHLWALVSHAGIERLPLKTQTINMDDENMDDENMV
ncbi:hypothetical protein BT93_D1236 [Corymbia citriodora subsp. variegata]|nr:hypothetical protein BT93_D1236 [Corymbia citriodora subsp. variegata]